MKVEQCSSHTTLCIAKYNYNWPCARYANVWGTEGIAPAILNPVSRSLHPSAALAPPPGMNPGTHWTEDWEEPT